MDMILKDRGHGKTCDLIKLSSQTGYPIVCATKSVAQSIKEKAHDIGINIPPAISARELKAMEEKPTKVYIDDLRSTLEMALGCEIAGFTQSINERC